MTDESRALVGEYIGGVMDSAIRRGMTGRDAIHVLHHALAVCIIKHFPDLKTEKGESTRLLFVRNLGRELPHLVEEYVARSADSE